MQTRIDKATLVRRVAQRAQRDEATVGDIIDATLEEIYEALKQGEPVSLRQFVRRAFGWSSTTQGE